MESKLKLSPEQLGERVPQLQNLALPIFKTRCKDSCCKIGQSGGWRIYYAINKDKRKAAQDYISIAKDTKNSVDDIFAVINDKDYAFTLSPEKVFKTAVFMGKVGSVKDPPVRWQDLFFPDIHSLPGD